MEAAVDSIKTAVYLIAGALIVSGTLTFGVGIFATEMLAHPTVRLLTIGLRSAPTRANAVIQGLWFALLGAYLILSTAQRFDTNLVVFVFLIPLAYVVLKRSPQKQEDKEDLA